MNHLDFWHTQGYAQLPGIVSSTTCSQILTALETSERKAGSRQLLQQPWCADLAKELAHHPLIARLLAQPAVAVQCNLFQKTTNPHHGRNWLVSLHQDLSIPALNPVRAPGWQGWSVKEGMGFVQAPAHVLEQMVALRVHLDDCGPLDGALRVVPGSHRFGVMTEVPPDTAHGTDVLCTAKIGDVLALRPLLLHASSKATGTSRRRVLHFVYGPRQIHEQHCWPLALY
jgi:hypothetical protein